MDRLVAKMEDDLSTKMEQVKVHLGDALGLVIEFQFSPLLSKRQQAEWNAVRMMIEQAIDEAAQGSTHD